ncbi:unnamed protein product [Didymodactylos carnosus]|uniref:Oligopeptide transporter n=1 Tax=Didymodactylos carnosus TaxID=1234261 RepID=A0A815Q9C2_9BILA|nr:unnamed protein product [Didymodactylos carnosus]CAF1460101.1 unnamed protein product [Didymodactylos carnosus]CAF4131000.1 unnamed protein product [Didymodactylos carnosus]CAF4330505.1 unnamed protein product [Didymodactylos carnosus]
MRRFLVWPSEMIWPYNLPYIAFLRTIHEKEQSLASKWLNISRIKFFIIVCTCSTIYYFLPGYIMPVLTAFSWLCYINPKNVLLSQLTGNGGFGFGSLQFDWASTGIAYLGSPILSPRWAQMNILVGFILFIWIFIPIFYYTNVWNFKNLPISSPQFFYNTVTVNLTNGTTIDTQSVSLTATYVIGYNLFFASLAALIVHTILYHGQEILKQSHTSLNKRQNDVHCTMMSKYNEVPDWEYGLIFLCAFLCACICCHYGQFMPWYYLFLIIPLTFLSLLPAGIVRAQSNIFISISNMSFILGGLLLQNDPIGNTTFYNCMWSIQDQPLSLLRGLKFGHYMKISPRAMFSIQLLTTILTTIVKYSISNHLLNSVPGICDTNLDWQCLYLGQSGILYSQEDPSDVLGRRSIYSPMLWLILVGALLPIIFWLLKQKFPHVQWLQHVHIPIMLATFALIVFSSATAYLTSWLIIGFIFHTLIRKWWWDRYALLFSIAMDMGVQISLFFIFFVLKYRNVSFPQWWGIGGQYRDNCPLSHANYYGKYPE